MARARGRVVACTQIILSSLIWLSAFSIIPVAAYAEGENHNHSLNHGATVPQADEESHAAHQQHSGDTEASVSTLSPQKQQPVNLIAPSGHHHHRPPLLPPDQDQAYSELNHHIAGVFVLLAGGLAILAASGNAQYAWAHYGLPGLFFLMGVFLLFRHDPESWPHGPLSLQESLSDPQIIQHVLFTFIILGIGAIEWLRCRGTLTHPLWNLVFPALAVSAAFMLFTHKHGEGPSAEKIYRHHVIMAVAGVIAMIIKGLDDLHVIKGKLGGYLWSGLVIFVGFMLLIYSE